MAILFRSARLGFAPFTLDDVADVYACITPEVARFMRWDPPASYEAFLSRRRAVLAAGDGSDLSLVIRRVDTLDCLGVAAMENIAADLPEVGLWLRVDAHGQGYGSEVVRAVIGWAASALGSAAFEYPVAVENVASRRIAERLGGHVIGHRHGEKYDAVVYRIPAPPVSGAAVHR